MQASIILLAALVPASSPIAVAQKSAPMGDGMRERSQSQDFK